MIWYRSYDHIEAQHQFPCQISPNIKRWRSSLICFLREKESFVEGLCWRRLCEDCFRLEFLLVSRELRSDSRFAHWLEIASRSGCDNAEHRATRTPNSIDVWIEIIILKFHWWSSILILLLTLSLFALVGFREDHCIAGLPLGLFPDTVRSLFRRAGLCSGWLVNGHFFDSKLA